MLDYVFKQKSQSRTLSVATLNPAEIVKDELFQATLRKRSGFR